MPVTKTAKRALRGSLKKKSINDKLMTRLELYIKEAERNMSQDSARQATSLADRAAKKKIIHKNKAARIKSQLSKLTPVKKASSKKTTKKSKRSAK